MRVGGRTYRNVRTYHKQNRQACHAGIDAQARGRAAVWVVAIAATPAHKRKGKKKRTMMAKTSLPPVARKDEKLMEGGGR